MELGAGAGGAVAEQCQCLEQHAAHLRAQLLAAQEQLSAVQGRLVVVDAAAAEEQVEAGAAEAAALQVPTGMGSEVAAAWAAAVKEEAVVRKAHAALEAGEAKVSFLERLLRVKEAELPDAKRGLYTAHQWASSAATAGADQSAGRSGGDEGQGEVAAKVAEVQSLKGELEAVKGQVEVQRGEAAQHSEELQRSLERAVQVGQQQVEQVMGQVKSTALQLDALREAISGAGMTTGEGAGGPCNGGYVAPVEVLGPRTPESKGLSVATAGSPCADELRDLTPHKQLSSAISSSSVWSAVDTLSSVDEQEDVEVLRREDTLVPRKVCPGDAEGHLAETPRKGSACIGDIPGLVETPRAGSASIRAAALSDWPRPPAGVPPLDLLREGSGGRGLDIEVAADECWTPRCSEAAAQGARNGTACGVAAAVEAKLELFETATAFEAIDIEGGGLVIDEAAFQQSLQKLKESAVVEPLTPEQGEGKAGGRPPHPTIADVAAEELVLCAAAVALPHPDKRHKGGEDAYFLSCIGHGAIGVADGVGGWIEDGVDPGEYSRLLMIMSEQTLEEEGPHLPPEVVMQKAQAATYTPGSSTACIATMGPDGQLHVANLGDSGLKIIRGGALAFSSQTQQHCFNMPYQLAYPPLLPDTDTSADADVYSLPMQSGDIIIMATDGLFDNLWDNQLLEIVRRITRNRPRSPQTAELIAKVLADTSHDNAMNRNFKSPWAVEAAAAGALPIFDRLFPRGGKLDDCTVVVAFVDTAEALRPAMKL